MFDPIMCAAAPALARASFALLYSSLQLPAALRAPGTPPTSDRRAEASCRRALLPLSPFHLLSSIPDARERAPGLRPPNSEPECVLIVPAFTKEHSCILGPAHGGRLAFGPRPAALTRARRLPHPASRLAPVRSPRRDRIRFRYFIRAPPLLPLLPLPSSSDPTSLPSPSRRYGHPSRRRINARRRDGSSRGRPSRIDTCTYGRPVCSHLSSLCPASPRAAAISVSLSAGSGWLWQRSPLARAISAMVASAAVACARITAPLSVSDGTGRPGPAALTGNSPTAGLLLSLAQRDPGRSGWSLGDQLKKPAQSSEW